MLGSAWATIPLVSATATLAFASAQFRAHGSRGIEKLQIYSSYTATMEVEHVLLEHYFP